MRRRAHREAARELYEEAQTEVVRVELELYVDLHGLHPEEAVEYLEKVLMENNKESRPIFAITGSGHHSKNGKDKVAERFVTFSTSGGMRTGEFSVPGDRGTTWVVS